MKSLLGSYVYTIGRLLIAAVIISGLLLSLSPTQTRADNAGYALAFDGVNDMLRLTYTASIFASTWTTTKTVEVWVKPEGQAVTCANSAVAACDYIFGDKPEWWGITRGIIGGQDRIWVYNFDGNMDQIGVPYTPGEWVHIAMVHSNGILRVYRNGFETGAMSSGATRQPSTGGLPVLFIGGVIFNRSRNYTLQGQIDEVRLWNIGRSAAEIQADRERVLNGDEPGLAAYYQMSNGSGLTVTDDSVNNWNGTLMDGGYGIAPTAPMRNGWFPKPSAPHNRRLPLHHNPTATPEPPTATPTYTPDANLDAGGADANLHQHARANLDPGRADATLTNTPEPTWTPVTDANLHQHAQPTWTPSRRRPSPTRPSRPGRR